MKLVSLKTGLVLGMIVLAAGCGKDNDDDKNIGDRVNEFDVNLTGKWRRDCSDITWTEITKAQDTYEFTAVGDFTRTLELHTDGNCSDAKKAVVLMNGTYVAGADRGEGKREINFIVKGFKFTPENETMVKVLNTTKYCAKSDWAIGQAVDLLDRDCAGERIASGETIADVYKHNSNLLYFGKTGAWVAGRNASDRPTEVAQDKPYAKQ